LLYIICVVFATVWLWEILKAIGRPAYLAFLLLIPGVALIALPAVAFMSRGALARTEA
jgi:hypothetical protein